MISTALTIRREFYHGSSAQDVKNYLTELKETQKEFADMGFSLQHTLRISGSKSRRVRTCRVCGCTDADCRQCIKKTGMPCRWVEKELCSACKE